MSEYSRELLKQIDFTLINETRKKNASILISELKGLILFKRSGIRRCICGGSC